MNRVEKAAVQELLASLDETYRVDSIQTEIAAWRRVERAVTSTRDLLEQPAAEDEQRGSSSFSTEYYLECWYPDADHEDGDGGEWSSACGWEQDNYQDAIGMLDWCEDYRRRVVRVDTVSSLVVLGQREPDDDDSIANVTTETEVTTTDAHG